MPVDYILDETHLMPHGTPSFEAPASRIIGSPVVPAVVPLFRGVIHEFISRKATPSICAPSRHALVSSCITRSCSRCEQQPRPSRRFPNAPVRRIRKHAREIDIVVAIRSFPVPMYCRLGDLRSLGFPADVVGTRLDLWSLAGPLCGRGIRYVRQAARHVVWRDRSLYPRFCPHMMIVREAAHDLPQLSPLRAALRSSSQVCEGGLAGKLTGENKNPWQRLAHRIQSQLLSPGGENSRRIRCRRRAALAVMSSAWLCHVDSYVDELVS